LPVRDPGRQDTIKGVLDSYHATDGCPPLATHWGAYDLAKTDWLLRFAEEIADDNNHALRAWDTIKEKCDTSYIIELLYLLTIRAPVTADKSQIAHHHFTSRINRLISNCEKLQNDMMQTIRDSRFSSLMPYERPALEVEIQQLEEAKKRLGVLRDSNKESGSYRRNPRDWYLLLLAMRVREATGKYHLRSLTSLLDAARAAHGEHGRDVTDEETLKKRIQRWADFTGARIINGMLHFRAWKNKVPAASVGSSEDMPPW
jgi:hypothetical protein